MPTRPGRTLAWLRSTRRKPHIKPGLRSFAWSMADTTAGVSQLDLTKRLVQRLFEFKQPPPPRGPHHEAPQQPAPRTRGATPCRRSALDIRPAAGPKCLYAATEPSAWRSCKCEGSEGAVTHPSCRRRPPRSQRPRAAAAAARGHRPYTHTQAQPHAHTPSACPYGPEGRARRNRRLCAPV